MKKLSALVLALAAASAVQAGVVTSSFSNPMERTEINQTGSLNFFDSSLGVLTGVALSINGQMLTNIALTNNASQAQTPEATGFVNLYFSSSLASLNALFQSTNPLTMTVNVLPTHLDSGQTVYTGPLEASRSSLFDSSLNSFWADFSRAGGGQFNLGCTSKSGISVFGGGGNIGSEQSTTAACSAEITYTYGPSTQVPEPASLALVALAMVGATVVTRRRQR